MIKERVDLQEGIHSWCESEGLDLVDLGVNARERSCEGKQQ
jgi:hypothetical protein